MRRVIILAAVAACCTLMSCQKETDFTKDSYGSVQMTFTASQEAPDYPDTKTELDGNHVLWSPGDVILVYNGVETSEFSTNIREPSAQVDFSGVFSSASASGTEYFASYGAGEYQPSSGGFIVNIPQSQTGVAFSFPSQAFPSIAHTKGTDLRFYNVCGGIGFTFTRDDIASVTIRSNGGENIAGGALVAFSSENRPYVKNASLAFVPGVSEVTLTAPYGTFASGVPYYVSLLPCNLESGITIIMQLSSRDGWYLKASISKPLSIKRSVFGRLSGIDENLEVSAEIPEVPGLIDLGLSVRWAEFNLGAADSDQKGYFYAWGETEPKENYIWSTYKWGTEGAFTKYSSYPSRLGKEDDAASVKLGEKWRMPTAAEIEELRTGCTWTWETSGSRHILVGTSKINGAQIRFPQTGCYNGSSLLYDTRMAIWSSDLSDSGSSNASNMQSIYSYGTPDVDSYRTPRYWGLNIRPVEDTSNGHDYVDLGLPSGLKWATCNVGADSPEQYGDYFAWAETEPKESYKWATYKWMDATVNDLTGITKYTVDDYLTGAIWYDADGKFIGDGIYDLGDPAYNYKDDAARQNWGGGWRIPTPSDYEELLNKTTAKWTTNSGIKGYVFTSKSDTSKSIFFPAAGHKSGTYLSGAGEHLNYWFSSLCKFGLKDYISECAQCINSSSSGLSLDLDDRCYGYSIRPVLE